MLGIRFWVMSRALTALENRVKETLLNAWAFRHHQHRLVWLLTFRMNLNSPSSNTNASSPILLFPAFEPVFRPFFTLSYFVIFLALPTWNIFRRTALTFSHEAHSADLLQLNTIC